MAEDSDFAQLGTDIGSICSAASFVGVLYARAFSVGIPVGATPSGFIVRVKNCNAPNLPDTGPACGMALMLRLVKSPEVASAWRRFEISDQVEDYTLGDATDLWGLTWTRDEVNACTVGIDIKCDPDPVDLFAVLIDAVTLQVYHSGSSAAGDPCGGSSGNSKGGAVIISGGGTEVGDDDDGGGGDDGLTYQRDFRAEQPESFNDLPMVRCTASGMLFNAGSIVMFKGKPYGRPYVPEPGEED